MSTLASTETRVLGPAQAYPTPDRPASTATSTDEPEAAQVRMWRKRFETRKAQKDFQDWKKYKDEAKKFAGGELLDDADIQSWKSCTTTHNAPIVQVNLWRRIRSYFRDSIFSVNPNLAFRPKEGRSNPQLLKNASAVEAMVKHVWDECKQQAEARRTLTDAFNSNVSAVKTDYDPARQLYKGQWVAGSLIVDGECHGDLSRAMWVAEEIRLPASRILQNDTFDKDKRLRLYEKWKPMLEKVEGGGLEQLRTVYYVCSREGTDPLQGIKELAGEVPAGEASARKVAFAIVEDFDEFLFLAPDPYPYLDEDEFNYALLILEEEPGELYGSPMWKMLKGLIDAINWLITFHVCAMKKKAQSIVLVNKNNWKGGAAKLAGAAFMESYEVDGPPDQVAAKLDLGSGDMGQLQSAESLMEWLARISGFNEIAAGESSGRKTATEADYLQKNTSLVTKGANVSFDSFLNEMVRQVALATLYYVPQFSRTIGPDGTVMTQQVMDIPTPVPPPAPPPGADPAMAGPMEPLIQNVPTPVPVPAPPEEASSLGAVPFPNDPQQVPRMPDTEEILPPPMIDLNGVEVQGQPMYQNARAGTVLRRGVDYFLGPEVAMNWPNQPLEDVKRDLHLTFEAGSTRADFRHDQQQAAIGAMQVLGPFLQQTQSYDALYELLTAYAASLPLDNADRMVPPREVFIQGLQMAQMAAQQAQQQEMEAKAKGGNSPPNKENS